MKYPTAFDTSLGTNFIDPKCSDFFDDFLKNDSFVDCKPMSFYLTNSQSYFYALKKGLNVTEQVIDQSCSVPSKAKCVKVMSELDEQLLKICKKDFKEKTSLVEEAHKDFLAYDVVYETTCLKNLDSHNKNSPKYCYTEAIFGNENSENSDGYLYLLPVGVAFPEPNSVLNSTVKRDNDDDEKPSCSKCNHEVMKIYHQYSNTSGLNMGEPYEKAAGSFNKICKRNFANPSSLKQTQKNKSAGRLSVNLLIVLIFFWTVLCF